METKTINRTAESLAADLVEQGSYKLEDIRITAIGDFERGVKNDIAEVKHDKKNGKLHIMVRRPKKGQAPTSVGMAAMLDKLEEKANAFRLRSAVTERVHQLGSSPILASYLGLNEIMDEHRRAWLAYLIPHKAVLGENYLIMGWAFSKLLGLPVTVTESKPILKIVGDADYPIDQWRVGISTCISGKAYDHEPGIDINIGPLESCRLRYFLKGGADYDFLEKWAFPYLLPKDVKHHLILFNQTENQAFCLFDGGNMVGYSTMLT